MNANGRPRSSDPDLTAVTMEDQSAPASCWKRFRGGITADKILVSLLLIAVVMGFLLGFTLGNKYKFTEEQITYIMFPGELFMSMLKMMIIPLITSSLVASLASLDKKLSGKLGLYAIIYYLCTTVIAVIIGIIMVMAIRPGKLGKKDDGDDEKEDDPVPIQYAFMDLLRNAFPSNIVAACFSTYSTQARNVIVAVTNSTTNITINVTEIEYYGTSTNSMNIMGLVVFSIAMGIVLGTMGEAGAPVGRFFISLNEAIMKLVMVIMWYGPIGIFFLILGVCFDVADEWAIVMAQIGMYFATVCAGLAVHGIIVLPLLYFIIVRKNPYVYLKGVFEALLTALGTASSSATLPLTTKNLEENNNIDKRVTRFVLPIGATINMDGTALYEAVAAIFVAQYNNISLNAGQVITISITSTIASIGAAGIPQAGLVTMIIVFTAVGLPLEDISLILAVDIILDRIRTMINVEGDSIGAGIVAKLAKKQLDEYDDEHEHDEQQEMVPLQSQLAPSREHAPPSYAQTKDKVHLPANKPSSSWNENAGYDHESASTPL